jgi:CheY-like chemotaxis protein
MAKKILIVEDYDDARRLYKHMLEHIGFSVIEAADGYEAVEKFNEEHPNLVLMDMALPCMDGLAATRRIKQANEIDDVPVIGITAHGNFYNEKAIEAGCDAIMSKPIDLNKMSSLISFYVSP